MERADLITGLHVCRRIEQYGLNEKLYKLRVVQYSLKILVGLIMSGKKFYLLHVSVSWECEFKSSIINSRFSEFCVQNNSRFWFQVQSTGDQAD